MAAFSTFNLLPGYILHIFQRYWSHHAWTKFCANCVVPGTWQSYYCMFYIFSSWQA